ncbi:hypothetical protein J6590_023276 [Homalodisca vitripennis]|nr:hypothetical protein J6590_023276 [Homalodisca vitripennis]
MQRAYPPCVMFTFSGWRPRSSPAEAICGAPLQDATKPMRQTSRNQGSTSLVNKAYKYVRGLGRRLGARKHLPNRRRE